MVAYVVVREYDAGWEGTFPNNCGVFSNLDEAKTFASSQEVDKSATWVVECWNGAILFGNWELHEGWINTIC